MKYIKIIFLLTAFAGFTSCLKSNHDIGGLLTDKGSILTSISETAYANTDAQNVGLGFDHTVANFNFGKRPNESVKFFTLKISQPLQTKLSGPLVLKVSTSAYDAYDATGTVIPVPTGAISVKDITVPASNDKLLVVPVFFTVNKTLLDPTKIYGIKFTLTAANQGAISAGDKSVNVIINYSDNSGSTNTSDYEANYTYTSSVVDAAGVIGLNNLKTMYLTQTSPTTLEYADQYTYVFFMFGFPNARDYKFLVARNFTTGALVAIFRPSFTIDASGKVTGVTNASGSSTVSNLTLDATGTNQFVYTSNNNRTFSVKYSFTYTTTINGVVTPRTIKVSEDFSYDPNQIYY